MKRNQINQILMFVFATLAIAVSTAGCMQAAEPPRGASLAGIQILFKLDPRLLGPTYGGERWVPPTYGPVRAPGNTYAVEARAEALDQDGQRLPASFEWTPEDAEMVVVSPGEGNQVTITIQRAGESNLVVTTAQGLSKTLSIRATQQKDVIQVEISQADDPG